MQSYANHQICSRVNSLQIYGKPTSCKLIKSTRAKRLQICTKFATSLSIRKFSANLVLNLHTCKRICKFVGNFKLANNGIVNVQTNSKFSSISLQRICIACNFLANPTFRPVSTIVHHKYSQCAFVLTYSSIATPS